MRKKQLKLKHPHFFQVILKSKTSSNTTFPTSSSLHLLCLQLATTASRALAARWSTCPSAWAPLASSTPCPLARPAAALMGWFCHLGLGGVMLRVFLGCLEAWGNVSAGVFACILGKMLDFFRVLGQWPHVKSLAPEVSLSFSWCF